MRKKVNIKDIVPNSENPRTINKYKFNKLVDSLKEFPEMLDKRPLVVDENMVVLGGNMRLKALQKAGLKEIPIDIAKGWSDKQKKEFIIKDNVSFGDWDWDVLANTWDINSLENWGLDIPAVYFDDDAEPEIDKDKFAEQIDTYINNKIKQIVLYFSNDDYIKAIEDLEKIRENENLNDNTEVFIFLIKKYGL